MRQAHNTIWSQRQQNRGSNAVQVPEALGALDRLLMSRSQKQPRPRATHHPTLQRQGASGEGTHTSVAILKSRQCRPLPFLQSQEPSLNPPPTSSPCPREQTAGRAAAVGKEFCLKGAKSYTRLFLAGVSVRTQLLPYIHSLVSPTTSRAVLSGS